MVSKSQPVSHIHWQLMKKNGNTFWKDALAKEMTEFGIAFELLEEGQGLPPSWKKLTGHLVWDVNMDFNQKAIWELNVHKTTNPDGSTYAGFVSREIVRIIFMYEALNGLGVFATDIQNADLKSPSSQKDCIIYGSEFGIKNIANIALIYRAMYSGKSA